MPRPMAGLFKAALDEEIVYPAFLFESAFRSGVVRLWTGRGDLVWNGNTYSGVGWLIGMSGVSETTAIQANGIVLTLGGLDPAVIAIALAEVQKNKVGTIRLALRNAAGALIGDPEILFQGVLDISTVNKRADTATVTITYESRMKNLNVARPRRFTDADQKIDHPRDRFFEFVGTIQDKNLTWGG